MPPASEVTRDSSVVHQVIRWYEQNGRILPWREGSTPWGVLVSEVMLQQTPVTRVLPVWRNWMERWPSPEALAEALQADVVRAWGRLGYPRRALSLWRCAKVIVDEYQGEIPRDESSLSSLPGIGDYTAAAVASFAFGTRTAVLDTNVRRVIARVWRGLVFPPGHTTKDEREFSLGLIPPDPPDAVRWNIGAMELGALVCLARSPRCGKCPIRERCSWYLDGRPGLGETTQRRQSWHGSDRQVRGRILALLKESPVPVAILGHTTLGDVEPNQVSRCLESLVADGLIRIESVARGMYTL